MLLCPVTGRLHPLAHRQERAQPTVRTDDSFMKSLPVICLHPARGAEDVRAGAGSAPAAAQPSQQPLGLRPPPGIGRGPPHLLGRAAPLRTPGELLDALHHAGHGDSSR